MSEVQADEQNVDTETESESPVDDVENTEEPDTEEVVVSIGDESPTSAEKEQAQSPAWVTELRKNNRKLHSKNRKLEEQIAQLTTTAKPAETDIVPGKKPTIADDGIDYDAEVYEARLSDWFERKRKADERAIEVTRKQEEETKAWQDKLNAYGNAKAELKVSDYEDAEYVAKESLSQTQQGIILQGADNPALVVYALGKNPATAKKLAAITDPVKYAFAVAKLETQLKITKRDAPVPENRVVRGSAALSGSVDSTLEKLRSEAMRTGDDTKVIAYMQRKRRS